MEIINYTYSTIINKSISKAQKFNRDHILLKSLAMEFDIPYEILLGIFLIETTCRPLYYRIIEYIVVCIRLILAILFKLPLPNYTIGKVQIGIGVILNYYGFDNVGIHCIKIHDINWKKAKLILKSIKWDTISRIFAWRINFLIKSTYTKDYISLLRSIGTSYNGSLSYGYALEEIIYSLGFKILEPRS